MNIKNIDNAHVVSNLALPVSTNKRAAVSPEAVDQVKLSEAAAKIHASLQGEDIESIVAAKLASLKALVEKGDYAIDFHHLAEKLIEESSSLKSK